MNPVITELEKLNIVAIIPCHRVEAEIGMVIASLPPYLTHLIFVDDASPDRTAEIVEMAARNEFTNHFEFATRRTRELGEP